jgi:hypothetical protein
MRSLVHVVLLDMAIVFALVLLARSPWIDGAAPPETP